MTQKNINSSTEALLSELQHSPQIFEFYNLYPPTPVDAPKISTINRNTIIDAASWISLEKPQLYEVDVQSADSEVSVQSNTEYRTPQNFQSLTSKLEIGHNLLSAQVKVHSDPLIRQLGVGALNQWATKPKAKHVAGIAVIRVPKVDSHQTGFFVAKGFMDTLLEQTLRMQKELCNGSGRHRISSEANSKRALLQDIVSQSLHTKDRETPQASLQAIAKCLLLKHVAHPIESRNLESSQKALTA